jgi:hypothetical protein
LVYIQQIHFLFQIAHTLSLLVLPVT